MKTGIFQDSNEVYHEQEHIGASSLKMMAHSPGHFWEAWKGVRVHKKAYDEGQIVHSVLLEQSLDGFVGRPEGIDGRTKEGKAQLAELAATGKTVIDTAVFQSLERRLDNFIASTEAMSVYNGAIIEESHYAQDPETGLYIKARPDILNGSVMADLKTTQNMRTFDKQVWNLGYYIQAGLYSLVTEITTGKSITEFKFIAQEKTAPYGVQVFMFDHATVKFCQEKARELLNRVSVCTKENQFPIYDDTVKQLVPPPWIDGDDFIFEEVG